ncbi:MAG: nicotinate (nicotinamide) nucleotide adenylyltransferase [Lachnospiraceae bacterium]|nr:nicotinate (nicotinamide) nucleotide adenylyltransferase [Lachnospiraceae bacterium]
MKVGIYGGTFDPVHKGHLAIARAAKEQFGLDMVRIMPARIPPHKQEKGVTEDVHRLMMLCLALPVGEGIELDLTEFEREGVSYTSDTLTLLHERHPDDAFYYIIGEDSLDGFVTWHEPETIASLATILVAVRSNDGEHFQKLLKERNRQFGGVFKALSVPYYDISSTEIRENIRNLKEPHPALPERTDTYIHRFGLYGCEPTAVRKEALRRYEELSKRLAPTISAHRLNHSKGVAFAAAEYIAEWLENAGWTQKAEGSQSAAQQDTGKQNTAQQTASAQHGITELDSEAKSLVRRTLLAGLMHDCAKSLGPEETLECLRKHRVKITDELLQAPGIQHGPAGRVLARERFGIRDPEMLRAIGNHVNGSVDMCDHPIETAVYIADYTEPFREHIPTPPLPVIRNEALKDGIVGAELAATALIHYLEYLGFKEEGELARMHNALKKRISQKEKGKGCELIPKKQ